jgi:hypothetical protein
VSDVLTLLSGVSANVTGQAFDAGDLRDEATVQVETAGTVSAFSVQVQASLDKVSWSGLGSAITSVTAATALSGAMARYYRAVLSSYSGTGTVTARLALAKF